MAIIDDILIVEDSEPTAIAYESFLDDYETEIALDLASARSAIERAAPALVLLDVQLPDGNGIEFVSELREAGYEFPVIVITSDSSVTLAVDAIKAGANDFLEKPFSSNRLLTTVANVLEKSRLDSMVRDYEKSGAERTAFAGFIGKSLPMQTVYNMVEAAAPSKATVFITGESGIGKEVLARAIHDTSPRRKKPFVALNCGAIPKELIESEIFGHVKGAFTGANKERKGATLQANGGTLFLDEICEMDIDLQVKLLRFLQTEIFRPVGSDEELEVDVRIVCATNRNPLLEVREGNFREDLYYRLHVISIDLPALRDRHDDVMLIAEHLLLQYADEESKAFRGFTAEAAEKVRAHNWPGNIRELQNTIRQIVVLHDADEVSLEMLPAHLSGVTETESASMEASNTPATSGDDVLQPLWKVEQDHIARVLAACDDNIPRAAAVLEISPSTLYRKQAKA